MQSKEKAVAPEARKASTLAQGPVHLEHARILDHEDQKLILATARGEIRMAAKADGCLLVPEKGDLVLASLAPGSGACHVLCVLHKAEEKEQRSFDLGPGAELQNHEGTLRLQGECLRCEAKNLASASAQTLRLEAVQGQARFANFRLAAHSLTAVVFTAKTLAHSLDQRAGRLVQRLGNSFRRISGMERVIAERVSLSVEERLTQKAKNASLQAEKNVSINAEHIDLG